MATPNAWDEYRRRRNLAWFAFLGYVPICFGVGVLSIRLFSTSTAAFVVAVAWIFFFVIAGNFALRFPCPRCGKPFLRWSDWLMCDAAYRNRFRRDSRISPERWFLFNFRTLQRPF